MKIIKHLLSSLFLVFVLLWGSNPLFAQSCIYGGGPIYQHRDYAINELRSSGFNTVVVWTIHIDANGNFNFNAEFPLCQNGNYVGGSKYPNFASDMSLLKTAPTSVNRIDFCLSAWGSSTFANIKSLIKSQGTGPSSALYQNFQALKNAIPEVDGIGFDDESTYDSNTATALAIMLADLGFKVSLVPYTNQSFWTAVALNTNAQRPGTVDRIDLQCYAGGASNTPCNWDFGDIPIYPGLWDTNKTPAQVQSQLTTWKNSCSADGGFMWLYDDFDNSSLTAQYAGAVNTAFGSDSGTSVATVYQHCNYGGYAVSLPVGSYMLSQLQSLGVINDDISSITVNNGYQIQVYWDDNFLGSTLTFTMDNACLVDEGWNDKISSIRVRAASSQAEELSDIIIAYPNPVATELALLHAEKLKDAEYNITDKSGKIVASGTFGSGKLDVSALPPDIYVLHIDKGGQQFIQRFIKK